MVIPFRNERNRIAALIQSINELSIPATIKTEFVFVDDHSDDLTHQIIENKLNLRFSILLNEGKGKKKAINTAIAVAQFENILTWDADIKIDPHYFEQLATLSDADMWILPVEMKGKNLIGRLASVDFSWLQMLTYFFGKLTSPFMCNGANLLFKKSAYLSADKIRSDEDIASGDDLFLMTAMARKKMKIRVSNDRFLAVVTNAPETNGELLRQRKRWGGKMGSLANVKFVVLFILLTITVCAAIASVYYSCLLHSWMLLIPVVIKCVGEYVLLRFYKGSKEMLRDVLVVLIHQVFFPLYLLLVGVVPKPRDSRWDR